MKFQCSLISSERGELVGRLRRIFDPFTQTALSRRNWIAIAVVSYTSKYSDFLQTEEE